MFGFAPFAGVPFATNVGAMLNVSVTELATAAGAVLGNPQFSVFDYASATCLDSVSSKVALGPLAAEQASASDLVSAIGIYLRLISESVEALDSPAAQDITPNAVIQESAEISDQVFVSSDDVVFIAEGALASDAIIAASLPQCLILEGAGGSDIVVAVFGIASVITESAEISDIYSSLTNYNVTAKERAKVTGLASATHIFPGIAIQQCRASAIVYSDDIFTPYVSEGVFISDAAISRPLWEIINTFETTDWGNIDNSQTSTWGNVDTAAESDWQLIQTLS